MPRTLPSLRCTIRAAGLLGLCFWLGFPQPSVEARCRWVCKLGNHCTTGRRCYTRKVCTPRKSCRQVKYFLIDKDGKRVNFNNMKCEKLKPCRYKKICRNYKTCRKQKRCIRMCGIEAKAQKSPEQPKPQPRIEKVVRQAHPAKQAKEPATVLSPQTPQCPMHSVAEKLWNFLNLERSQAKLKGFVCPKDLQKVATSWSRLYCRTGRVPRKQQWEVLQQAGVYPRAITILEYRSRRYSTRRWERSSRFKNAMLSKKMDQIGIGVTRCGRRWSWVAILIQGS
ncbi:MAG: hypothetical protein EP343_10500 [Deltaproteobacteria bacterium]|nr:MAG: hypothetical protein EP343_10500 [Deltaproteobacteria bacterium]